MMQICVTGGTGFVGRAVVKRLQSAGHTVRLLRRRAGGRPDGPAGAEAAGDASAAWVELADCESVARALKGADAVVHLVGIISEVGSQTFEHVHRELTSSVVAAAGRAGLRHHVQVSALGVRPGAVSRYHRTKWEAEERVRSGPTPWTILRPSLIHGAEDGFTNLFLRMASVSPFIPLLGGGPGLLQPIAVERVAEAVAGSIEKAEARGRTFDLCGPERLSLRELLTVLFRATGRRRWLVPVPWPVARMQARVLEWVFPRLLGKAPPLNRDQILMLQEDNVGDGSEADRLFGLVHEPLEAAWRRRR